MFKPEILAPGGSFNAAIHAFEAGAEAVYIGMSSFSARKGAKNFTIESLRSLKNYTKKNNKKIFVAINTVLKEDEMGDIFELLHHLFLIEVDAVILQDPGLAYIMRNYFPQMKMHASTQMAVHNSEGIMFLKNEGFSRIILARELTLDEIRTLRELHRDVELEVFIHGAMCFSFSGICLASGTLLGRSGNRGECGQICRTWFESEKGNNYQFSANDLKAGELVEELQNMKIDSLKIEGRMKSPEYVSHTVSYYRALIDGSEKFISKNEEKLSSLSFSRNQTSAFFKNPKGEDMINNQYASHTGISAGKIISSDNKSFLLKSETDLSDRDGLLIIHGNERYQFAMKSEGKKNHYREGESLTVLYKDKVNKNASVFKVSGHDLQLKEFKEDSWKPWKTPIKARVELTTDSLIISTDFFDRTICVSEKIPVEDSKSGKDIREILMQNISKSGASDFSIIDINMINSSGRSDNSVFLPLSDIKRIKALFYEELESQIISIINNRSTKILKSISEKIQLMNQVPGIEINIPDRKEIPSFFEQRTPNNQEIFLPLIPLLFHKKDFEELEKKIELMASDQSKTVILGINNISHFHFVKKYKEKKNIYFFTDYNTYIANRTCELFYREKIEKLLFSYYWIEDPGGELKGLKKINKSFKPHLFISRICYKKHNGLGSCKDCSKDLQYDLKQRNKDFTVVVKDCITWLYQKE
ncbi:MAG: U32 family peptidase [Spirochaetaceae bacterium]|jgi:putative protease|nr:U32 family peptidase [Spirochaetaceae bacterium]